ncbi:MAG: hypothetical protein ACRDVZ_15245 [Jiangellaceae bacterium]
MTHVSVPIAAAVLLSVTAAGCSGGTSENEPPGTSEPSGTSMAAPGQLPQGDDPVTLDPAQFTTEIDNPYWPMSPGTRWTYRETDGEGNVQEVVVVVTDQTKETAIGVTARVVRDTVTVDGEIIEDTVDWYAQDQQGNIWYLGEDTAEFEDGEIASREGSFEAGVDGALPGIIIPADPQPGMQYRQEYFEGEAEDNGAVLSIAEMAEVPFGQFTEALLTKDTNALEPDVLEYKLYAKDVGPVLTLSVSGGAGREELLNVDQVAGSTGTGPLGTPNP